MKTNLWLSFFAAMLFFSQDLNAQCINGTASMPLYKVGAELVQDCDDKGLEIVHIEYDIVFSKKEAFRKLFPDWEYTIIAFADNGVKDLDIEVYEYDGIKDKYVLIASDNGSENFGIVKVTPKAETMFRVEIKLTQFHEGFTAARYGLMYVHD